MQLDNITAFYNATIDYIENYIIENNIENKDIHPSEWIFILLELQDLLYKPNKSYLYMPNNKNKYDPYKVIEWYKILVRISYKYKKEISIYHFECMTSISNDYIYKLRDAAGVGAHDTDLYKMIQSDNENSLSALLQDKKVNPMHYLPILNKKHNWNDSGGRSGGATVNLQLVTRDAVQALESKKDVPNLPTI